MLPGSEFYARKESTDRLASYCKRCHNATSESSRKANIEGYKAWRRQYRKRDREKQADYQRMYRFRKRKGVAE